MSETIEELRKLSDEEIIGRHDHLAKTTVVGTKHYEDELARRAQERSNLLMVKLTKAMTIMTAVITAATIVNIVLFAIR